MTTRLITPPAEMAVSLATARLALRDPDASLNELITIEIGSLTADAELYTQRSIINRTYQQVLDVFPNAIKLNHPPIVSVTWLKYYDTDGALQTLDPADYQFDSVSEGYLVPAPDAAWPETQCGKINAVIVEYVAGYGPDHTTTPEEFKSFILGKLQTRFDPEAKENPFIENRLNGKKIWSLG